MGLHDDGAAGVCGGTGGLAQVGARERAGVQPLVLDLVAPALDSQLGLGSITPRSPQTKTYISQAGRAQWEVRAECRAAR